MRLLAGAASKGDIAGVSQDHHDFPTLPAILFIDEILLIDRNTPNGGAPASTS